MFWRWVVCLLLSAWTVGTAWGADAAPRRVVVGALLPLSGENATVGREARNGIELAWSLRREELLKEGLDLRVVFEDDRLDPERSLKGLQALIAAHHVPLVLGPFSSSGVIQAAPLALKEQVVLLSGSASSPRLRELGDFVFSSATLDDHHGKALARFAIETLRVRSCGVMYMENDYGRGLKALVETEFSRLGGEPLISMGHASGETDFLPQIDRLRAVGVQCVFVATYPLEAGLILKQARAVGMEQPVLGGDGIFSQDLIEVAGPAARNTYATALSWRPASSRPASRAFVKAYRKVFQVDPTLYAANYFDVMQIVIRALRETAATGESLRDYLAGHEFEGVTGTLQPGRQRTVDKPVDVYKVEDFTFDYFYTILPR